MWKITIYFFLVMAGWIGFTTWAPTLLNESKGVPLGYASFLTSIPMLISLAGLPIIGWLSDRIRKRRVLIFAGSALMTLLLLLLPYTPRWSLIPSFVILGIAFSFVPGTVFSIAGEVLGPGSSGTGFAILNTGANAGWAIAPYLIGLVLDYTGSATYSFLIMSIFVAPSIMLALLIRGK